MVSFTTLAYCVSCACASCSIAQAGGSFSTGILLTNQRNTQISAKMMASVTSTSIHVG